MARNREQNQGKGRNLGQGVANLTDEQRRDLAPSGDEAPTEDQRGKLTSGERGHARDQEGAGGGDQRNAGRDERGNPTRH